MAAVGGKVKTHLATSMLEEMETDELESLALEMGMTVKDGTSRADLIKAIAAAEGVTERAITAAIQRGLENMKKYLKNVL